MAVKFIFWLTYTIIFITDEFGPEIFRHRAAHSMLVFDSVNVSAIRRSWILSGKSSEYYWIISMNSIIIEKKIVQDEAYKITEWTQTKRLWKVKSVPEKKQKPHQKCASCVNSITVTFQGWCTKNLISYIQKRIFS